MINGGYFARRVRGAPRVVVRAGDYLPPANLVASQGATPSTAAAIFVFPFWHDQSVSWDRAGTNLTTAQAGAACRIGAYDYNNGNPNGAALLSDFGEIDLSSGSGMKTATISWTNPFADFWIALHLKDVATQVTARCGLYCLQRGMSILEADTGSGGQTICWRKTQAYAALPTSLYTSLAPWGGTSPIPYLRAT